MATNQEVIKLLERYLEKAKTEDCGLVGIILCRSPNEAQFDWTGEIVLENVLLGGMDKLGTAVKSSIDNCQMPKSNPDLDASYVVYDVATGPLGFDFMIWLVNAEMSRIREGAPGPLKVGFWQGRDPERVMNFNATPSLPSRSMWLNNVFRPLLTLFGAVEDISATAGRREGVYVPRRIVDACKRGEQVPMVSVSPDVRYAGAITITLREAEHHPDRNSNISAWTKFADYLRERGQRVVFVRDTLKADEPLEGYETYPQASTDLLKRAALYEAALANLFVSNGPVGIALFNSRPWLQFVKINDEGSYVPNTSGFWRDHNGVEVGKQYPWSNDDQRIVWKPDTYENIIEAWESIFELRDAA